MLLYILSIDFKLNATSFVLKLKYPIFIIETKGGRDFICFVVIWTFWLNRNGSFFKKHKAS